MCDRASWLCVFPSAQEHITTALLAAIRRPQVSAVEFVNEGKLAPDGSVDERRVGLLRRWVESGLELGQSAPLVLPPSLPPIPAGTSPRVALSNVSSLIGGIESRR